MTYAPLKNPLSPNLADYRVDFGSKYIYTSSPYRLVVNSNLTFPDVEIGAG